MTEKEKDMRTLLIVLAVTVGLAALPAGAAIIDNDHIYIWGDPFGDQFDNYAEVQPGETIVLQVWVNDLDGPVDRQTGETLVNENWARVANGVWAGTWWDPIVVDWLSVHEHRADTYYSSYWSNVTHNAHGQGYRYAQYEDTTGAATVRWVAENKYVIGLSYTIRDDAPLGPSTLGLQIAFSYSEWFFNNRIENDQGDPYAMTLNVVPEPATAGMMVFGAVGLLRRRRRGK